MRGAQPEHPFAGAGLSVVVAWPSTASAAQAV